MPGLPAKLAEFTCNFPFRKQCKIQPGRYIRHIIIPVRNIYSTCKRIPGINHRYLMVQPSSKIKIPVLKNARVYVTGQNLFLITDYTGLDPEVVSSVPGTGESPRGIDFFSYPRAKTFLIGASVTF